MNGKRCQEHGDYLHNIIVEFRCRAYESELWSFIVSATRLQEIINADGIEDPLIFGQTDTRYNRKLSLWEALGPL